MFSLMIKTVIETKNWIIEAYGNPSQRKHRFYWKKKVCFDLNKKNAVETKKLED